MSIHVALNHVTRYRYDRAITLGPQVVRLRPAPHCRSRILSYSLRVTPAKHFVNWQQDPESNYLARLVFPEPTEELCIEVDLIAEMAVVNPFDFFLEPHAEKSPFTYETRQKRDLAPYLETLPETPLFEAFLAELDLTPRSTNDFLVELNRKLSEHIRYVIRLEPGLQTPEETLTKRSGSCRDSAWLLVMLLRRIGLAARFVSGYLIQLVADEKPLEGPAGPSADFTDLHAWCEVYLPGAGWVGLDPTSGLLAGEGHLPLACTADPASAAPLSGLVEKSESTLEHTMHVTRVWEAPRVTKPYTEADWGAIEALGHALDAELGEADVRLTMGGEPTFISLDDPDGAEWTTEALGPTKKRLAADLFHRLRDHYAPQGLVHFGQGKWYPGEPLPRWALTCFWRNDGAPLWIERSLVADESAPPTQPKADAELAARLLTSVARQLDLAENAVFPAFEDAYYYLWRERRLPSNVDPFDARLDDPLERERLRRVFTQGLGAAVGHVLPIAESPSGGFRTGPWFLRGERCLLIPGDSPLGFRLPLDAQPWVAAADRPAFFPPDPGAPVGPLPSLAELRHQRPRSAASAASEAAQRAPALGESARDIVRTALCAEPRGGVLYVFMPPIADLEAYLALASAVEVAAGEIGCPVLLEGYEPPRDPRLTHFRITPDPGVIEVNIHPAASWDELVLRTTHLYEVARASRLTTEKFLLDGRHSGTGGGNHVVLGGATVADSPFLRRPDLLRSLIAYWHQHPSLSYLFSGLFVGPTSQAPRVDEARNDSLFELELAFREITRGLETHGGAPPPWFIDRALRDVLIDVTGNTHRAEFCIDKLFSPDSPAGRLGLLELRAFEMPPHARMSLTQNLLLRALVARFWKTPFAPTRLARWGTELHDRFLLPHFVWQDLGDVLSELGEAGFPLEPAWFLPHLEFRFPKYGDHTVLGIELELRAAIEPWHVLGEEATGSGTARYVDSSLERLQLKVSGMAPDRYVVACNGVAVPLHPTGRVGELVAGVRYRAWQPPRCLHPHIPVDSPLTFDVIDTWMGRSVGGCQYHVTHPGGRSFERLPVNAFEAEGRRLARFFRLGHSPGRHPVEAATRSLDFPLTLDLRHTAR
jgi:uncharacterized protein (DUF2126 family)/transglutaminase-like putative cysteine protease